jgi:hypothetical protein
VELPNGYKEICVLEILNVNIKNLIFLSKMRIFAQFFFNNAKLKIVNDLMKMKAVLISIVLLTSINLFSQIASHEVILKNGEILQIEVYQQTSKKIYYWTDDGKKASLLIEDVKEITPLAGASKLMENYKDDMTGANITKTFWSKLRATGPFTNFYQLEKIDSIYYLRLRISFGSIFSVAKGDKLIFKFENNDVITLLNTTYIHSCRGCGVAESGVMGHDLHGVETRYQLSERHIEELKNNKIVKGRFYMSLEYIEDEITEKRSVEFIENLKAITN